MIGRYWSRLLLVVALALCVPVSATAQDAVEYYGTDAIGSVRIVFDANGNIVGRMDYGPFGEQVTVSTVVHKSYAGLFRDGEAGLDYAEARSYQVRTGRFNAPDPVYAALFAPQAWNRYAYAVGDPLGFTDSSGLEVQTVNCQLGAYWCPGQVNTKPEDSDKYFDPSQYGYHGGEEAYRAEAAYGMAVASAFIQFRETARQQKESTATVSTKMGEVTLPNGAKTRVHDDSAHPFRELAHEIVGRTEALTESTFYLDFLLLSAAGGSVYAASGVTGLAFEVRTYPIAGGGGILLNKLGENIIRLDWHTIPTRWGNIFLPHVDIPHVVKHWPWPRK